MFENSRIHKIIILVLLLAAGYFPLFLHLDSLPLFGYDESRTALNAIEMLENGNFLVAHFNGEPDMWNTKPPLMLWLQALSLKLFGVNELAVRLPAALAALLTVFLIGFYCHKYLKRTVLGICTIGVLITTPGYISDHVSRTGDFDALLILFTTLFLLTIFEYTSTENAARKNKLILWASFWLSLAVLTKGVAGLLFLPAVAIWLILKKEGAGLLKAKHTYLTIGLFLVLVGSFYMLREIYNPGYLEAVWNNELGGRYLEVLENHVAPFSYYFKNMWTTKFLPWIFFLPLALLVAWFEKGKTRELLKFLLLAVLSFLLIISFSSSKFEWYDAPVYPLLAIVIAIAIEKLYLFLQPQINLPKTALLLVFCIAVFGMPYQTILAKVYWPRHSDPMNQNAGFMKAFPQQDNYAIVNMGYNAQIIFYRKLFNEKGYDIRHKYPDGLHIGEQALICEEKVMEEIKKRFRFEVLEEWKSCQFISITSKKE